MRRFVRHWQRHFLHYELVACTVGAGALVLGLERSDAIAVVQGAMAGSRSAMYGALVSVYGALLGFAITVVSIIISFAANERLTLVRGSTHYPMLWRVFFANIRTLGLATFVALAALLVDRDAQPNKWALYATLFVVLLSSARLARCVWALHWVISIVTGPSKARTGEQA